MLHLENKQQRKYHSLFINPAEDLGVLWLSVGALGWLLTCLQAAHIWSISFSRLVQRAARKAAVLPGVGNTALPGAPGGRN